MEKEINYFVITNDENEVLAVIDLDADEVIESDGIVVHEMNCDDAEFSETENGDIFLCEGDRLIGKIKDDRIVEIDVSNIVSDTSTFLSGLFESLKEIKLNLKQ